MTGAAPEDYLVSGAADIDLLSAAAEFDGTGAGADFQPAVQILDESGQVVATALGSTVTAGDSASVTFAPFLRGPGGGTDPNAIRYDVNNDGTFLSVEAADFIEFDVDNGGSGFTVNVGSGVNNAISLSDNGTGNFTIDKRNGDIRIIQHDNTFAIRLITLGGGEIDIGTGGDIFIAPAGGGNVNVVLPIVNPGGSGNLWNNAGVVNIT